MAQPTTYNRTTSFANYQAQNPTEPLPGSTLDAELNAVKVTLDAILANIELIQRDDGALANESVGLDQLSPEIEVGWQAPEVWVTATDYIVGNTVFHGSGFYRVLEDHTSGTFATDLAADKLELIVDLSDLTIVAASQIANTPAGTISATTVQAAIDELASEKAALSHTHPSSAITDSTAAGRTLLTAANAAAQRSALSLGALALLDTIAVTDINAELALTGIIEPAALSSDQNDWAPTGVATASTIRASASATGVDITGILAPVTDGSIKILENVGSFAFNLSPQSSASAAANRFAIAKPITVSPNSSVAIKYDLGDARWRVLDSASRLPRGWIDGLILSNNSGDTTNDIDVATGECRGERGILDLVLVSALTGKRLDADWAAGSSQGMRYSGAAISNTTYHLFLIGKIDGTVDLFAYAGGTDPTSVLPSGYVDYRRIGSILRESAAIVPFVQVGDDFLRKTPVLDTTVTATASTPTTATIKVPTGIKVWANLNVYAGAAATTAAFYVYSPDATAQSPSASAAPLATSFSGGAGNTGVANGVNCLVRTNTSAQVGLSSSQNGDVLFSSLSWRDPRGRDA